MSFWSGRAVLVTGGAGFIGSHLVRRLVDEGARVRVVDDMSSGHPNTLRSVAGRIELRRADVSDREVATAACRDMEAVFHLAARLGGRGYIQTHPVDSVWNMVIDGMLFAAAQREGVQRLCFTSSACVYPIDIHDGPAGPVSLREDMADPWVPGRAFPDLEHGWAKLMSEMALQAYHRQHGLRSVVCRVHTAYGEGENETHAIMAFIARAHLRQDPFTVWGDGTQSRNFIYIDDIVEGLLLAAEKIEDATAVNIGTEEQYTINETIELIFELMGFHPRTIAHDLTKLSGVPARAADLGRARQALGWEPRTSLRDGLRRTIDWYVKERASPDLAERLPTLLMER